MNKKISCLQQELNSLADESIAQHSQHFFKTGKGEYGEGDKFLGIRVPVLRQLAKKYREFTVEEAILLLDSQIHEQRQLALFILTASYQKQPDQRVKIYNLYLKNTKLINNWDLVDISAHHIIGHFLMDKDKTPIYELACSGDLWQRRIAIIATFYFIRQGEFKDSLKIAKILLQDPHDLIHKAVGWMLREIGNRNRQLEETFLSKYYRTMPRTMLRYAIEKFPQSLRKAYLAGKVLG